jgi:hypothetical protein
MSNTTYQAKSSSPVSLLSALIQPMKKEQLDKFKSSLKARYKLVRLDALLDLVKTMKSSKVETKVNIQITGTKSNTLSNYFTPGELREILKGFVHDCKPMPEAAFLTHSSYPYPKKVPRRPTVLDNAYQEYLNLE